MLYLKDYERVSAEVTEKSISIDRKKCQKSKFSQKDSCNEQVLIHRNVNHNRRTSSPNKPKSFKECYIDLDLSPISKDVLSNLIHDSASDN